jgi:hypothetical protein
MSNRLSVGAGFRVAAAPPVKIFHLRGFAGHPGNQCVVKAMHIKFASLLL